MTSILEKIKYYNTIEQDLKIAEGREDIKDKQILDLEKNISQQDDIIQKFKIIENLTDELKNLNIELQGAKDAIKELTKEKEKINSKYLLTLNDKRRISAALGGTAKENNKLKKEVVRLQTELLTSNKLRDPRAVENYYENFIGSRKQRKSVECARVK